MRITYYTWVCQQWWSIVLCSLCWTACKITTLGWAVHTGSTIQNLSDNVNTACGHIIQKITAPSSATYFDSSGRTIRICPHVKADSTAVSCNSYRIPVSREFAVRRIWRRCIWNIGQITGSWLILVTEFRIKQTIIWNWRVKHDIKLTITINISVIWISFCKQIMFSTYGQHNQWGNPQTCYAERCGCRRIVLSLQKFFIWSVLQVRISRQSHTGDR